MVQSSVYCVLLADNYILIKHSVLQSCYLVIFVNILWDVTVIHWQKSKPVDNFRYSLAQVRREGMEPDSSHVWLTLCTCLTPTSLPLKMKQKKLHLSCRLQMSIPRDTTGWIGREKGSPLKHKPFSKKTHAYPN